MTKRIKKSRKKREKVKMLINKYVYQKLKIHFTIERLKEEERLRKLEEERKAKDKIRYEKERKIFQEEDINFYKEKNEDENQSNSDLSDYE